MTIRAKSLIVFITLFTIILTMGGYIMWVLGKTNDYLRNDVPETINGMANSSYLDNIAELIRYDDEVLTQSARNYAFTGDTKWKERYNTFVPKLDLRIEQALEKGDSEDKFLFITINTANTILVKMEGQAILLSDQGQLPTAQKILDSDEYLKQKEIYKINVDKYLAKQGGAVDEAVANSTEILSQTNINIQKRTIFSGNALGVFILVTLIFLGLLFYLIFYSLLIPLAELKQMSEKISQGDLTQHLDIKSKDEMGQLVKTYNQMTVQLKESRVNIEAKVDERTEDLRKLNKFMTGRELKMVELKKKIEDLERKNAHKE